MKTALCVEYKGANYQGWQRQPTVSSVQGCLEKALSQIANEPIEVFCAGRTDSGVHGTAQVVHFEHASNRGEKAWVQGTNTLLPGDIKVRWSTTVSEEFHARFSATARRYRYFIQNTRVRSALFPDLVTNHPFELNAEHMNEAAQALMGEQDFSAFRAADCQSNTPMRCVTDISVTREGEWVVVDLTANAFLHHMVRNIVGSLIPIGEGHQPITWMAELLAGKDRKKAGPTAKPNGLYLIDVRYADHYDLPRIFRAPEFVRAGIIKD